MERRILERFCIGLWVIAMASGVTLSAQEGNYKFENFGNASVLLNGNVTGSVADLGLVYYNPARLALIEDPSFTVGGKAYEWSTFYFNEILQTDKGLKSDKFGGIPATVSGTFTLKSLPGHKFAYSILSRNQANIRVKYNSGLLEEPIFLEETSITANFSELELRDRLRDDWFGITWAFPISETFGVGVSLFGSIYHCYGQGDILITADREDGAVISYLNRLDFDQKTYGGIFKIGSAWVVDNIEMGANITLPFIPVKERASTSYYKSLSGFSADQDFLIAVDLNDLPNKRRTATEISFGMGIPWKSHKIHLNLDWHAAVSTYDRIALPAEILANMERNPFQEELKSVFNYGVGAEFNVSPSLNIIGSFSSDYSAFISSINLFDFINQSQKDINLLNDLWHVALGGEFTRPWGNIILGTSYASSRSNIGTVPEIPSETDVTQPRNVTTRINYERWRFVIGIEIPLLQDKMKDLPIPIM